MIKRFNINRHLYRPSSSGQNVIDSHMGGNITDNAVEATAPTEEIIQTYSYI